MTTRKLSLLVALTAPLLGLSIASASERTTCPAASGGSAALLTVGDRTFAPAGSPAKRATPGPRRRPTG